MSYQASPHRNWDFPPPKWEDLGYSAAELPAGRLLLLRRRERRLLSQRTAPPRRMRSRESCCLAEMGHWKGKKNESWRGAEPGGRVPRRAAAPRSSRPPRQIVFPFIRPPCLRFWGITCTRSSLLSALGWFPGPTTRSPPPHVPAAGTQLPVLQGRAVRVAGRARPQRGRCKPCAWAHPAEQGNLCQPCQEGVH